MIIIILLCMNENKTLFYVKPFKDLRIIYSNFMNFSIKLLKNHHFKIQIIHYLLK